MLANSLTAALALFSHSCARCTTTDTLTRGRSGISYGWLHSVFRHPVWEACYGFLRLAGSEQTDLHLLAACRGLLFRCLLQMSHILLYLEIKNAGCTVSARARIRTFNVQQSLINA